MDRSTSSRNVAAFVAALVLISIVAVLATGAFGRTVTPEPTPSEVPSDPPSQAPTPLPTVAPSPTPGGYLTFDLDVATPHDVSVVLDDEAGIITGAKSGRAGAGMSVRWGQSIVENIDDDTIRMTWVGLPQDDIVEMVVKEVDGRIIITVDQAAPPANSDAMGHDRVVEIDLSRAVDANDVRVTVSN
ncbi:MAG: hypothetical protein ACSLFN_06535 [Candidatus Limnocylindrales bacterium]